MGFNSVFKGLNTPRLQNRRHHHHQFLLLLVEHRASTKSFQALRFPATPLTSTVIKTNRLMMYEAKIAVCSDIVQNTQRKASTM